MSPIIDRSCRRGSVLMEFVIVLPIYLTFLGAVFVTGEMALKSIHLASTERSVAHEQCDKNWSFPAFQEARKNQFSLGFVDEVSGTSRSLVADTDVLGPWTQFIAGKATDVYSLPKWTRSWLQYPARLFGVHETWDQKKLVVSKDVSNVRSYNFYTYLRVPRTRGRGYRTWSGKELSGTLGKWTDVYREVYMPDTQDGESLDRHGGADGKDPEDEPNKKSDYNRYGPFVGWSGSD